MPQLSVENAWVAGSLGPATQGRPLHLDKPASAFGNAMFFAVVPQRNEPPRESCESVSYS